MSFQPPLIMGILNVTPDSFYDGGRYLSGLSAVEKGEEMVNLGADVVDIGGESTRPGAEPVSVDEELKRVIPVIEGLAGKCRISIDTMKPEVARAAVKAGAEVINDVSGLVNPEMREVAAEFEATVCIMHMKGEPRTMQVAPAYDDVVAEVRDYLVCQAETAMREGIAKEKIWIDPGIGFGKTADHNLSLLKHISEFTATGYPVLVGVSRKSFIGKLLSDAREPLPVEERLDGTLAAQIMAMERGAQILRVHDVQSAKRSVKMASAILSAR